MKILRLMVEMDGILQKTPLCTSAQMMGHFYGTIEGQFLSLLNDISGERLSPDKLYECVCFIAESVATDPLTDKAVH